MERRTDLTSRTIKIYDAFKATNKSYSVLKQKYFN